MLRCEILAVQGNVGLELGNLRIQAMLTGLAIVWVLKLKMACHKNQKDRLQVLFATFCSVPTGDRSVGGFHCPYIMNIVSWHGLRCVVWGMASPQAVGFRNSR